MKSFSKFVFALFVLGALAVQARATEVPNCFRDGVRTGRYLIMVDLQAISKTDLVHFLKRANGRSITPSGYPIFFLDSKMLVITDRRPLLDGSWPAREAVEVEIRHLIERPGITSVECDTIVHPTPRVGGGN